MVSGSKKRASSPIGTSIISSKLHQPRSSLASNANGSSSDELEFEDKFEDEYESEDVMTENEDEDEDEDEDEEVKTTGDQVNTMQLDQVQDEEEEQEAIPYLPQLGQGQGLAQDEELVPDLSSYVLLHHARLQWPCLSFDTLRDNFGFERQKPPFSTCVVAGTQAAESEYNNNEIVVMKWDNLTRAKADNSSDSEAESDDDDEQETEDDAIMHFRSIPHVGGVNRVRAQPLSDQTSGLPTPPMPYYVASFSESAKVHIYDVAPQLHSLLNPAESSSTALSKTALHTISAHGSAEGFALDWDQSNRLLSGDVHSKIFLSTLAESNVSTSKAFASHTSSVEDLQWSPSEQTVFASCSADKTVRVWDIRVKERKSVLSVEAHDSDVNVMSWNKKTSYLLVSGGDEGGLKVWDLRSLKSGAKSKPTPVAAFNWHSEAITSVEWHPTEESCFVASGADDQVTLWDLSVELDDEERATNALTQDRSRDVPAQLLFVHQGQTDIKEVHWHPQIPGTVISTAATGLDIFKTISL